MDDARFETRVRCAAAAGWRTSLIAIVWLTVGWCVWMGLAACPSGACARWVECMWGGVKISDVLPLVWVFFGVAKMLIFVCVLVSIFLTIWHRQLKKAE